jgi:hypothetical protein
MKPEDIISELQLILPNQIRKEHDYRVNYLRSLHAIIRARPRARYYQMKRNAIWMSLYSHINWLAHFKALKAERVDSTIPPWLASVLGWPLETIEL